MNHRLRILCLAALGSVPLAAQMTISVPGTSQILLAGQPDTARLNSGDTAAQNRPVLVTSSVAAGQAFQFAASGAVNLTGGLTRVPDVPPVGQADRFENAVAPGGARFSGPLGGLIGMFTANSLDALDRPDVNYSGSSRFVEVVEPYLQQIFYIGDGRTPDGFQKTYVAPAGATRLFLAVAEDMVRDNGGLFEVSVQFVGAQRRGRNPLRVPGTASVLLAGQTGGTFLGSVARGEPAFAGLHAPVEVSVPLVAGQTLRISASGRVGSGSGLVSREGVDPNGVGLDGRVAGNSVTGQRFGLASVTGPNSSLIGVFVGTTINAMVTPPDADFRTATARNQAVLRPLLQQPFFVGTGRTEDGQVKSFVVPAGATRLFLAVLDPGSVNNGGSFLAVVSPDLTTTPRLTSAGVVNAAAGLSAPVAAGSIIAVFGTQLSGTTDGAAAVPLPGSLAGTQVFFGLRPAPLYFVSPGQINLQVPFDQNENVTELVVSRDGVPGLPVPFTLRPAAPGIFLAGERQGVVVHGSTGQLVTDADPARAGEVLVIYANGLGPVEPRVASGEASPSSPPAVAGLPVRVEFEGASVVPDFAGLTPQVVGLYQVNARVPAGVRAGRVPMRLVVAGATSNTVDIAIAP